MKRTIVDAIGRTILRYDGIERAWLTISRRFPQSRFVQSICFGIRRGGIQAANPYRTVTLKTGARLLVDISDIVSPTYFYQRDYEPETVETVLGLLNEGDNVVDIGAHCGYFSILMASKIGKRGHVHAFEPNPELVRLLKDSISLNAFGDRITVNQSAVSAQSSNRVAFYVSQLPGNTGVSSLIPHQWGEDHGFFDSAKSVEVNTTCLDDYFAEQKLESCALVKIDVESAETLVIKGMSRLLSEGIPKYVICETAAGGEADRMMSDFGYSAHPIIGYGFDQPNGSGFWGNILYRSQRV